MGHYLGVLVILLTHHGNGTTSPGNEFAPDHGIGNGTENRMHAPDGVLSC